jgi:hypothetical protein
MEAIAAPVILSSITEIISSNGELADNELCSKLSAQVIEKLQGAFPEMAHKFVVQSIIVPQPSLGSVGLSMSSAAFWDTARDCTFNVKWENKERQVVVSVTAVSL